MTSLPPATAGEAVIAAPALNSQTFRPLVALMAYSRPSSHPKYVVPPDTTGDESTPSPAVKTHRVPPLFLSREKTILFLEAKITWLDVIAGEAQLAPRFFVTIVCQSILPSLSLMHAYSPPIPHT